MLSDIDKFLFENFPSLYHKDEETSKKVAAFPFKSQRLLVPPKPEFFISTGSSGSLHEASSSATNNSPSSSKEIAAPAANDPSAPEDFIALLEYSASPYEDFRRSMQELVGAWMEHNGKVDWKFLEELLFCYLDLNNKKSYRFILEAFVDVIVALREKSGKSPASQHRWSSGDRRRQLK
ncbi:hypothetical protein ACS0TY_035085 [Phlomoides rotata]